jgi:triacylglycerol esterase/lipase EstA (alpha/beta hydrolase family)
MARRLLFAILLLQLCFALAVAGLAVWLGGLWGWSGPGWPAALLLGLASVVLVRLVISGNNFRMARRAGGAMLPQHRLTAPAFLRMFAAEFAASMTLQSWTVLRPRTKFHLSGKDAATPVLPVLLVHGYGCDGAYWSRLARLLRQAGASYMTVDLEPMFGGIDDYAPQIEAALQQLCAATGKPQAIVVGHSMGGLAARAHLRAFGSARVARVITVGTPHHGTALAGFGPGLNARQMQRNSEWLAALAASEQPATRALIVSLWSHHDNIVAPQDSARLPGARNVELAGIGHVALGSHPDAMRFVLDEICRISHSFVVTETK